MEIAGLLNGAPFGVFVGNGFIRSERLVDRRGSLNGILGDTFLTFYHSTRQFGNNNGRNA